MRVARGEPRQHGAAAFNRRRPRRRAALEGRDGRALLGKARRRRGNQQRREKGAQHGARAVGGGARREGANALGVVREGEAVARGVDIKDELREHAGAVGAGLRRRARGAVGEGRGGRVHEPVPL